MSCTTRSCSSSPYSYTWAPIWLIPVLAAADRALQRRWQRQALIALDDRLLNDIGVTRDQAREESRKPLWR